MTGEKVTIQVSGNAIHPNPSYVFSRIFAPATYIFFASAIPALAFGEQIDHATSTLPFSQPINFATDGALNGVNILAATAICGLLQVHLELFRFKMHFRLSLEANRY